MDAIILAAGRGSRLGNLTSVVPKPLALLAGKPIVEWQIHALQAAGIQKINLVTGYASDKLIPYGDDHIYNPNWATSNMVRSLMLADSLLNTEPYIISYGDIVYRSDIISELLDSSGDISITFDVDWWDLWSARFADPLSDAESFQHAQGCLLSIGERVSDRALINGQYMGLLKFSPTGWLHVRNLLAGLDSLSIDKLDMTSLLRLLLQQGITITVVPIHGGWVEVDNPSDIELYEHIIQQDGWSHDWRV
ncbi:phosphocholine cytidylyltransferase family protein [Aeromonas veronii]|uniref:phosphocholine cytidylyltransferase family protein n=1 Tax=Aeromonas veronii TaxID=654 RepID=UPI00226D05B7|nr:phosphocholine cytidylyltransferase family protein [Aeromonas veronii]MCX9103498.1 phosphocholine cytidylyltransferase family protein [Aeromonas veronii]MCX9119149.1 phosphocholine cytidylyltransferase family protein [Aeromonas veronii]